MGENNSTNTLKKPMIFLSRRREEDPIAKMLLMALPRDWSVWIDELELGLGKLNKEKIIAGVSESTHMIVVWSEDASANAWVNQEVGAALQKGIPVLPIIQRGSCLKGMLEGIEGVYYDPKLPYPGVKEFVEKLEDQLKKDGYKSFDMAKVEKRLKELWEAFEQWQK